MATLDTGTVIEEQWNAVFYTDGHAAGRTVAGITIHHWGDTNNFDVVTATFCNGGKQTSAHYAVEDGRAACYVSPDDVAWACGNWEGNLTTISIECRPRASDGDYAEVASLIRYLRGLYGDLPLYPHAYWTSTACPGVWDLGRLDALARGGNVTPQSGQTVTPIQEEELVPNATDPVFVSKDGSPVSLQDILNSIDDKVQTARDRLHPLEAFIIDVRGDLRNKGAQITALSAAIQALASERGTDPQAVMAAVREGVSSALSNLQASVELKAPTNG
jgi:hypothetical protein